MLFRSDLYPDWYRPHAAPDHIREIEEAARTAMTIVAHSRPFVVGVDTHARNHVYAIIAAGTGELLETQDFPTTSAGINRALAWVARRTGADLEILRVIEGAASYGAVLAGAVGAAGYHVAEAARMDARSRHGVGKSDPVTHAGSPLPSCPWKSTSCAGRG